jgi:hypothetical protein
MYEHEREAHDFIEVTPDEFSAELSHSPFSIFRLNIFVE